jgi:hypothetical protein
MCFTYAYLLSTLAGTSVVGVLIGATALDTPMFGGFTDKALFKVKLNGSVVTSELASVSVAFKIAIVSNF